MRSSVLGNVGAVQIYGDPAARAPVGFAAAPAKVKRVLENLGLQPGAPTPELGGVPRCPPSFSIKFLEPNGQEAATAGFMCGGPGSADRKNKTGYLAIEGGKKIARPGRQEQALETKDGALVAKTLKALKADEVPDPNVAFPRCLPTRVLELYKGDRLAASIGVTCGDDATGTITGSFSSRDPQVHGGVKVDAGIVLGVERSLTGGGSR